MIEGLKYLLPSIGDWNGVFPTNEALRLVENYHLSIEAVEDLADNLGCRLNRQDLQNSLDAKGTMSVQLPPLNTKKYLASLFSEHSLEETDDSYKYDYKFIPERNDYFYGKHQTTIVGLLANGNLVNSIKNEDSEAVGIATRSTNFYATAGGQISDRGVIQLGRENLFKVSRTMKAEKYVVHFGEVVSGAFRVGDEVVLELDRDSRLKASQLHTAAHLLRAAVEAVAGERLVSQFSY